MYEVVLIDRNSNQVVGNIGTYDDHDEAEREAQNYNRKSDRHRGFATVQGVVGGSSPRQNPFQEDDSSEDYDISSEDDTDSMHRHNLKKGFDKMFEEVQREKHNRRRMNRSNFPNHQHERKRLHRNMTEQRMQRRERLEREHHHRPRVRLNREESFQVEPNPPPQAPQPIKNDDYCLLFDERNNNYIVLKNNKHLEVIMTYNPHLQTIDFGSLHQMIYKRNQCKKGI